MRRVCLPALLLLLLAGCIQTAGPLSASVASSYRVTEAATGRVQVVGPLNDCLFHGTGPDFSMAILAPEPARGWIVVLYDSSQASSSVYPMAIFGQLQPDPDNPAGAYGRLVGETPDPAGGLVRVAPNDSGNTARRSGPDGPTDPAP